MHSNHHLGWLVHSSPDNQRVNRWVCGELYIRDSFFSRGELVWSSSRLSMLNGPCFWGKSRSWVTKKEEGEVDRSEWLGFFFPAEHCYLGECSCILCSGPGARMSAGGSGFHLVELYPSSWTSSLPGGPLQTALLSKTSLLFLVRVLFAPLFCLNKNPSEFEEFEPICDCRSCHLSLCHHSSNLWQKLSYSWRNACHLNLLYK